MNGTTATVGNDSTTTVATTIATTASDAVTIATQSLVFIVISISSGILAAIVRVWSWLIRSQFSAVRYTVCPIEYFGNNPSPIKKKTWHRMHIHLFVQRLSVNRITQKRMLRFFWVWNWKYRDSGEFDPLQKSLVPCTTSKMGWSGIDYHPFPCKLLAVGVTPGALPMPTHNYRLPPPLLKFDKYMNNVINLFHTEYWFYILQYKAVMGLRWPTWEQ